MIKEIKRYLKKRREKKKIEKVLELVEAGRITPNEARRRFGLPPIGDTAAKDAEKTAGLPESIKGVLLDSFMKGDL